MIQFGFLANGEMLGWDYEKLCSFVRESGYDCVELIDDINPKDADMVRAITESVAKLNASLKGNNIFTPRETDEERLEREANDVLASALRGE